MTRSGLKATLFAIAMALTANCSAVNDDFCTTDEACGAASSCQLDTGLCVANPDAGEDIIPEEPTGASCQASGQQCIAAAPQGWTGPIAKTQAESLDALSACAGEFAEDLGSFGTEISETGDCECDCGSPTSLSCGGAKVTEWTSNEGSCELGVCDINGGSCTENTQTIAANSCRILSNTLFDEPFLRGSFGAVLAASCSLPELDNDFASEFSGHARLCQTEALAEDCPSEQVCAPSPSEEFSEGLCIVQEGEHECPVDLGYTERTVLFADIDDNRECQTGSCSCDTPSGSCGGKLEFFESGPNATCVGTPLVTLKNSSSPLQSSNLCQARPAAADVVRYTMDIAAVSCRKNGEPEVAGSAVGTGATTVCCMP